MDISTLAIKILTTIIIRDEWGRPVESNDIYYIEDNFRNSLASSRTDINKAVILLHLNYFINIETCSEDTVTFRIRPEGFAYCANIVLGENPLK